MVDGDGNAVAVTYTINGNFGAAVVAPGTGFLLNNEMDDFTAKPGSANLFGLIQDEANAIAPGKRPLSSMTRQSSKRMAGRCWCGQPGGLAHHNDRAAQVLTGIVDHRLTPETAVAAPRFHHQFQPDALYYERGGLSARDSVGPRRDGSPAA